MSYLLMPCCCVTASDQPPHVFQPEHLQICCDANSTIGAHPVHDHQHGSAHTAQAATIAAANESSALATQQSKEYHYVETCRDLCVQCMVNASSCEKLWPTMRVSTKSQTTGLQAPQNEEEGEQS